MAYTPGLKVRERALIRKTRKLPVPGKVLVKKGEKVEVSTSVAEAELPGKPTIISVASILNVDEDVLNECMVKKVGDKVEKDEVIARYSSFFGLVKRSCASPVKGIIELVSDVSGQVVIREPSISVGITAYIPGTITKVLPDVGAIIETPGAFIQGIFGIGGETYGELKIISDSDKLVEADDIDAECAGKILVAKTAFSIGGLKKAVEKGAKGVIAGGLDEKDLVDLMGYEVGVAITGREKVGLTVIITEGFGQNLKTSEKTFGLLRKFEGRLVCLNGATQIRAGVIRPEVIIPQTNLDPKDLLEYDVEDTETLNQGLMPGTAIRIISEPYFGSLGHVSELPPELQLVETGSKVRVLTAELDDGRIVTVPRANVEIIGD